MFELILQRAVRIEGRLLIAGSRIRADANAAREWISSGRARLAEEADLARLVAAVSGARPDTNL